MGICVSKGAVVIPKTRPNSKCDSDQNELNKKSEAVLASPSHKQGGKIEPQKPSERAPNMLVQGVGSVYKLEESSTGKKEVPSSQSWAVSRRT